MNKSTALIPSLILFKRSVATTNFVVFGQTCVNTLPGDWGTPQQAERDKLSPDITKGWRAKGYPFPLLAKPVHFIIHTRLMIVSKASCLCRCENDSIDGFFIKYK